MRQISPTFAALRIDPVLLAEREDALDRAHASEAEPTRVMTTEELDAALSRDSECARDMFAELGDVPAALVLESGVRFQSKLEAQP